ncbi:MAG TPA: anti-sigma factor antagonist [Verrucomicrobia bacterium]|nr:anti-sigma factor antagonist [Verrucomicrobiota bacterium]
MNITNEKKGDVCVVAVGGRLDGAGAPEVESHCRALIEGGNKNQLLDLAQVEYISSAGLRSLLVVAKQVKAAGGTLMLCNLSSMVSEVMEISGFDKILKIAADRHAAIAQFGG